MATFSTSAVLAQTSNATFQAWVNEVQNALVTMCGLTQLSSSMDSGQMAVPSVTAVPGAANTSAGYYMFTFNDTLGQGPLVTGTALVSHTGGSGYDGGGSGTFTGVALTGGTGSGAAGTVVVASGVISSITPTTAGTGYNVGDNLTVTSASMVAAGAAAGGSGGGAYVAQLTSAASPVVIKLEFGSGQAAADPQMWVTVGTSWASAGTLGSAVNGAVTARSAVLWGGTPLSTVTAYVSRYCYIPALSFLGMVFKIGQVASATPNAASGCLFIYRHSSNAGAAIANGTTVLTTGFSASNPGNGQENGCAQSISYTTNTVYPTTLNQNNSNFWPAVNGGPGTAASFAGLATTLENGTVFVFPTITIDPVFRFSALLGIGLANDIPLGVTSPAFAIIGSTTITFLSVGLPFGGTTGFASINSALITLLIPWQ